MGENLELESYLEPTKEKAKSIQVINKSTVHRICSGQVVLNLATAVKELVENALDAGATSIEVKLQDYGSSSLEVCDNGKGIQAEDFESLALKHHTSKLQDFEDLVGVKTFGFRGEALSSLSALGNLSITTKCASEAMGTALTFCHKGNLINQKPTHRQTGTTVSLQKIFFSLPVRHKEFLKNLKKEFNKMVQVLYSYCIISTNVRIHCTNQCSGKPQTVIVSTTGHQCLKENIASIFTAKQVSSLLAIKQLETSDETSTTDALDTSQSCEGPSLFIFDGLISSCAHGCGRSAADRQFFFINNRPCDPDKIKSVINGVYHSYNRHQYPMVVLHVKTQQDNIDINVTPDKRKILVSQEKLLLSALKNSLVSLFEKVLPTIDPTSILGNQSKLPLSFSSPQQESLSRSSTTPSSVSRLSQFRRTSSGIDSPLSLKRSRSMDHCANQSPVNKISRLDLSMEENQTDTDESSPIMNKIIPQKLKEIKPIEKANTPLQSPRRSQCFTPKSIRNVNNKASEFLENLKSKKTKSASPQEPRNNLFQEKIMEIHLEEESSRKGNPNTSCMEADVLSHSILDETVDLAENSQTIVIPDEEYRKPSSLKSVKVNFSLDDIRNRLKRMNKPQKHNPVGRKFTAKISPSESSEAEGELKKQITKDMFEKMEIIGQFNLGFIIAFLDSDLFIIDQHATDEKYNFELLERTCVLQQQPLIQPHVLHLTPVNESILLDNMKIFAENGFTFLVDHTQAPGRKAKLISIPHSKGWDFGKQDIEEMIFMLSDAEGVSCRPSRVRKMFASRACRQSVMIGTALNYKQMKKLVVHMGEIEQPWNCPHGRPTIRHLVNLNLVEKLDELHVSSE